MYEHYETTEARKPRNNMSASAVSVIFISVWMNTTWTPSHHAQTHSAPQPASQPARTLDAGPPLCCLPDTPSH